MMHHHGSLCKHIEVEKLFVWAEESFEEFELAQQRLDRLLRVWLQGQTGGHVLRLLDPQLVGNAGLSQVL